MPTGSAKGGGADVIVLSMVLVVVGFVTLMLGVLDVGDNPLNFVYLSIGACILAGVFLIVGVLKSRPSRQPVSMAQPAVSGTTGWAAASGGMAAQAGAAAPDSAAGEVPAPSPLGDRGPGSLTQSLLHDRGPAGSRTQIQSVSADDDPWNGRDEEVYESDEDRDVADDRDGERVEGDEGGLVEDHMLVDDEFDEDRSRVADEQPDTVAGLDLVGPGAADGQVDASTDAWGHGDTTELTPAELEVNDDRGLEGHTEPAVPGDGDAPSPPPEVVGPQAAKKAVKKATRKKAAKKASGRKTAAENPTAFAGELERISGIGPTKQQRLADRFGSLEALRAASIEEIAQVEGISENLARQIHEQLGS